MAESGGFEPPVQVSPYNGLANRRLQPLGQLSGDTRSWNVPDYTATRSGWANYLRREPFHLFGLRARLQQHEVHSDGGELFHALAHSFGGSYES